MRSEVCKGANDTEVTLKWRTPPHFCVRESCPCPTLVSDSQQLIWRAMVKLLRTAWCPRSSPSSVSPPQVVVGYRKSMHLGIRRCRRSHCRCSQESSYPRPSALLSSDRAFASSSEFWQVVSFVPVWFTGDVRIFFEGPSGSSHFEEIKIYLIN
jgi:hypothetical protein